MTLYLLLFLQFASVQLLSANERKLPKGTANDKNSDSMNCFYCRHSNKAHKDLSDPLIERSECLSPEMFVNQSQFQRQCATHETFCMTSVSSMNGFFVEMRRDCAERCRPGCQESGYGLFSRQCLRLMEMAFFG
ncbi:hypothetical protein niasHT_019524 [Heterodera trifolii]|uniref:Uncharacterized protein n=1 Tax=Heterodera trifolii TaxID=157864 RepID=A0ABD2KW93_9BILA